jgi:hypothetical protein
MKIENEQIVVTLDQRDIQTLVYILEEVMIIAHDVVANNSFVEMLDYDCAQNILEVLKR